MAVIVAVVVSALPVLAKVQLSVSPNPILMGETGQCVLQSDTAPPAFAALPKVDGLEWLNNGEPRTSQQISIINFQKSATYVSAYLFRATKAGDIHLPALQVSEGRRQAGTAPAMTIRVQQSKFNAGGKQLTLDDLVFLQLSYDGADAPPPQLYLGQVMTVTAKLFLRQGLRVDENALRRSYFPDVSLENAIFRTFSPDRTQPGYQVSPDGKFLYRSPTSAIQAGARYQVLEFVFGVAGVQTGKLFGRVDYEVPVLVPDDSRRRGPRGPFRDPFDSFFSGSRYKVITHDIHASVAPVRIVPLPSPPANAGTFIGLIGRWKLAVTLDRTSAKVGEDVTLTLAAEGNGDVEGLTPPELEIPGFQVYPPEIDKQSGARSTARVKWVLVPKVVGAELPALKLSTFEAASGNYRVHEFTPRISILPGDEPASVGPLIVDQGNGTTSAARDVKSLTDILYIKRDLGAGVVPGVVGGRWRTPLAAGLLGPLLFFVVWLWARQRDRLAGSESFRRHQAARRRQRAVYRKLRGTPAEELPGIVRTDVLPYLLDLLDLPPGTTTRELVEHLDDSELATMLEQAEMGGFMPGSGSRIDGQQLLRRLRSLAVVLVLCCAGWRAAGAETAAETMTAAAAAYDDGRVPEARELYRKLLSPDRDYPGLLYNLGNCAYREGEYGQALSYYERARRLAPRDSDITENLNFVRSQLRLPPVGQDDSPITVLRGWRDSIRPDEWLHVAGGAWFLFWLILTVQRWRRTGFHPATLVPLVGVVLALGAWAAQLQSTYRPGQAVVTAPMAQLRALPHETERKAKAPLKAGDYVTVVERRSDWSRVRIDEAEGWIRNEAYSEFWD